MYFIVYYSQPSRVVAKIIATLTKDKTEALKGEITWLLSFYYRQS